MTFNNKFKLLAICVLCLNMYTQVRSTSISQIGDVLIEKSNGKWHCDRIECPPETDRCFVSKSNEVEPSVLKRINYCYSKDNEILKQHMSESRFDPASKIKMQLTSTRNGGIISSNDGYIGTLEDFDEETFNDSMNDSMKKSLKNKMDKMHENLRKMQHKLAHMFD